MANLGEFVRECRYLVIKMKDVPAALTTEEQLTLFMLSNKVNRFTEVRRGQSKSSRDLDYVVVEKDWPEFEVVWEMIEKRMANVRSDTKASAGSGS